MKEIAVLVSGGGTNLQALLDAIEAGKIKNGKITAVISSSPDAYALERAKKHGIKTYVLEPGDNAEISAQLIELLSEIKPDLIVLAGFMRILEEDLVSQYENRIINIHPALIPSFCGEGFYGLRVHEAALDYGVKLSGATVHFVDGKCDHGPVILQKAIDVLPDDTPESLQKRIMQECEWQILPEAVDLFCSDRLSVHGHKVYID